MARAKAARRTAAPAPTAPPTLKTSILFLALALYLGGTVFKLCMQEWTLFQQAQVLAAEKAELVAQSQELQAELAKTTTNAGIERLAREQLGLVRAHEIPVKTTQAPPPKPVHQLAEETQPAKQQQPGPGGLPPAMAALAKLFKPFW